MKLFWSLFFMSIVFSSKIFAATTHIQHIINNETPYEFYYMVIPTSEIPSAFSCICEGLIGPGEKRQCDCLSQLESAERRYRMEYMRNTSPSFRLSATHSVEANAKINWRLLYDSYWDWLSVSATHTDL